MIHEDRYEEAQLNEGLRRDAEVDRHEERRVAELISEPTHLRRKEDAAEGWEAVRIAFEKIAEDKVRAAAWNANFTIEQMNPDDTE